MSWFSAWVDVYRVATGADDRAVAALLANEPIIVGEWGATPEELGECATRLVSGRRVPKFANEHSDALGNELHHLRVERTTSERPDPGTDDFEQCEACGGSGLVVIPARSCVWKGRIVLHQRYRRVVTTAVLCDRGGCTAGRRARDNEQNREGSRRPTLEQAEMFHGVNLVALMRDYERDQARQAREAEPYDQKLAALIDSTLAKARRTS